MPITRKAFQTKTNDRPKSVIDDKLKPTSEMHILIGGPYIDSKNKENTVGHTALHIKTKNREIVYDFGRYGDVYEETILGHTLDREFSPRGEGVLRIWNSFAAYIAEENATGRTTWGYKYAIFDHQASRAIDYYQSLTKEIKPFAKTTHRESFKLKFDYFALGPNCTTLSINGAKKAIPEITNGSEKFIKPEDVLPLYAIAAMKFKYETPNTIFLPANLKKYLDTAPTVAPIKTSTYGTKR